MGVGGGGGFGGGGRVDRFGAGGVAASGMPSKQGGPQGHQETPLAPRHTLLDCASSSAVLASLQGWSLQAAPAAFAGSQRRVERPPLLSWIAMTTALPAWSRLASERGASPRQGRQERQPLLTQTVTMTARLAWRHPIERSVGCPLEGTRCWQQGRVTLAAVASGEEELVAPGGLSALRRHAGQMPTARAYAVGISS